GHRPDLRGYPDRRAPPVSAALRPGSGVRAAKRTRRPPDRDLGPGGCPAAPGFPTHPPGGLFAGRTPHRHVAARLALRRRPALTRVLGHSARDPLAPGEPVERDGHALDRAVLWTGGEHPVSCRRAGARAHALSAV